MQLCLRYPLIGETRLGGKSEQCRWVKEVERERLLDTLGATVVSHAFGLSLARAAFDSDDQPMDENVTQFVSDVSVTLCNFIFLPLMRGSRVAVPVFDLRYKLHTPRRRESGSSHNPLGYLTKERSGCHDNGKHREP